MVSAVPRRPETLVEAMSGGSAPRVGVVSTPSLRPVVRKAAGSGVALVARRKLPLIVARLIGMRRMTSAVDSAVVNGRAGTSPPAGRAPLSHPAGAAPRTPATSVATATHLPR